MLPLTGSLQSQTRRSGQTHGWPWTEPLLAESIRLTGGITMSPEENKERIRRYWEDVWTGQDRAGFAELMESGYAEHEAAFSDVVWAAFPDIRCEIVEMIAEGGTVATRLILTATHSGKGEFNGIPPSGNHASME